MCGIVGYIGNQEAVDILIHGLRKLEYRGYDSAGVAVVAGGKIQLRRNVGKLVNLEESLRALPISGRTGIGHTRWATHGRPSETNAHPHQADDIVIVHNGIIENYLALREELAARGCVFKSETDTEIVAHLIEREYREGRDLLAAVRAALARVEGVYALLVAAADEPDHLVAAKKSSPLVIGLGNGEQFVASDVTALLRYTNRVIRLEDGEIAEIRRDGVTIQAASGEEVQREPSIIQWNPVAAEKGGHKHFMHKEIFDQPQAVISAMEGRVHVPDVDVEFTGSGIEKIDAKRVRRVILLACGTAWHAAQIGRFYIETLSGIPCEVDLGSEFRYRHPIVQPGTVCVISQSGETADTLASLKEALSRGAMSIAVCNNVPESSLAQLADAVCYTHAGPEIGVASTKAFVTQLVTLYLLGIQLGRRNGFLSEKDALPHLEELTRLPIRIQEVLTLEKRIRDIAKATRHMKGYLFIGRNVNHYIALEGALKLKEISYLHAEGFPAGEMKHGPIALIDEEMLVVAIAPRSETYDKMLSNIQEARAREGNILAIVTRGDKDAASLANEVLEIPPCSELLSPILTVIPLQLLSYHIADIAGTDVDQPRNLAKSVTVE